MMREPAVAGQFYSLEKNALVSEIESCFSLCGKPKKMGEKKFIAAAVVPHAGYTYSGRTAAYTYRALADNRPANETFVIIGPNHSGDGPGISVFPEGKWKTPLGSVEIDNKLASKIADNLFVADTSAHIYEHSAEVQVPFLQYVYGISKKSRKKFKILPVCVMDQSQKSMAALGKKLAQVLDPVKHVVIASTDFSHYVPYDRAYRNDMTAIGCIAGLDSRGLYSAIKSENISMCGPGPVAATIEYARAVGAKKAELLKYMTSGDITGDKSQVVGYGALV
ncbi:MAG: MEMO1 family protein, partial [Candidatus Micrarchaeota archaeon]